MGLMLTVNIQQAKAQLTKLVARAAKGEAFIITRAGKPLVRVEGIVAPRAPERLGFLAGEIAIPPDFDRMEAAVIQKLFGAEA